VPRWISIPVKDVSLFIIHVSERAHRESIEASVSAIAAIKRENYEELY